MADATIISPAPPRKRRWLRGLLWAFASLVVLLVIAYFAGTSAAFLKGVILPKVSAALNAKVTVSDASVSPFSQVVLRGLKVETTGPDPLLTATEVRLRYSLMDIIRGHMNIEEVTLTAPTVTQVENPDGSNNLDPILKAQQSKPPQTAAPSKPSPPMQLDVKRIALNNGTVRRVKWYAGGKRDVTELSNVNLTLDHLKNGQTGKLTLAADIRVENNPPAPEPNGALQAKVNGSFDLGLTPDLKPGAILGTLGLNVIRADGSMAAIGALGASLECSVTPTELKQVALRLQRGGTRLGEILATGPFNLEKLEGRVSLQVLNIDKNLLNIAGATSGFDFGPTTVSSTNQIEITQSGATITAVGQFNLNRLQVTRTNQTTPSLDLRADYNVTIDRAASNAVVRALSLSGVQKGNQFLRGELTSPMTIPWGKGPSAMGDSTFTATISRFNLADWKAFAGDFAPMGEVNARLQLRSQQAGNQLSFDIGSDVTNLTVVSGTNQLAGIGVTLQLRGEATDMKQFKFPECRLQVARQAQPLITISGSGTYDKAATNTDVQCSGQIMLAPVLQLLPQPGMAVSSGTVGLKAHLVQQQNSQAITGTFTLADLTGRFGSNVFRSFGTTADLDVGTAAQQVQIRKLAGKITEGPTLGGTFDLSGAYNLTNRSTQLNARLSNFNQTGLRTLLEPMLGEKKLVSVALNGSASVQYDPNAASSIKADLAVTNLVVNDPTGQIPATPLEARVQMDAALNKNVTELRSAALVLSPTLLATNNQVRVTGRVDMSNTNVLTGNVRLAAETLDLTTYYDLFGGKSATTDKPPAMGSTTPARPAAPPSVDKKAEAPKRQIKNFISEAAIGRIYLHEVQITNLQATVKMDGDRILLDPCKLWLNGAPVSARVDLDLGVPGYKYDLAANALAIPLAPLVNTFQPERKGQLGGTFTAQAKVAGVGTTGAELKRNLTGNFDVAATNLNLALVNVRNRLLTTIINVVGAIPDMVRNPENLLGTALNAIAPQTGTGRSGSLTAELEKSPIDKVAMRGAMGDGTVQLQQAMVQSKAFQIDATGNIRLEDVLTNSVIDIPVTVSLSQPVAQKANLVPPNTPTNALYVRLPDFLTLTKTVGAPGQKINKAALLGLAARGASGLPIGGQAGSILQGVGNLLAGGTPGGTNAPATGTNRPATNANSLLQGLGGLLGNPQPPRTNAPGATNTPSGTNQSSVSNLLNDLLAPRKK
jgi:hypothetical protein